jgi:anti-anti-sigma factor
MTELTDDLTSEATIEDWLSVELQTSDRTCTFILRGALSGTSLAALEAQIDQLGSTACNDVVLDVTELKALDKRGARVLLGLYHYAGARGGQMRIIGAQGAVASSLRDCLLNTSVSGLQIDSAGNQ